MHPARRECRPGAAKAGAKGQGWNRGKVTTADREVEA
jgi:hypothetical protein